MKCANCNAEIKDGSIYCPVCGKEAQMISGYSSLEDDFLHSLLREDADKANENENNHKVLTAENSQKGHKKSQSMPIFITVLILFFCILIGIVMKIFLDYKNHNSYEYQMAMAESELIDHNFESAIDYLSRALVIIPTDIESRIKLGDIYIMREEYENAIVLLTEAVKLNHNEKAAYERLINIYAKQGQYGQIKSLYELVEEEDIKKLFDVYLVDEPVIYPASDKYNTHIAVTIVSIGDEPIYYTTDGSDPSKKGILYTGEIELTRSGFYTIKAVCKNIKNNVYSDVVTCDYQIEIYPPDVPKAEPDVDTVFSEPAYITLTTNSECKIYYTWDGSVPTKESFVYAEPIEVPEGEHILSAIAIDEKTGLSSSVLRIQYSYSE